MQLQTLQAEEREFQSASAAATWENSAIDAVGEFIEFWGFKRNQGRLWALLFLRNALYTASELEHELQLSKGGVSMLIRDLERWGVLVRSRNSGESTWRYSAEVDILKMARRVVEEREFQAIRRTKAALEQAVTLAKKQNAESSERFLRLKMMLTLADAAEKAVSLFVKTAQLDLRSLFRIFRKGE